MWLHYWIAFQIGDGESRQEGKREAESGFSVVVTWKWLEPITASSWSPTLYCCLYTYTLNMRKFEKKKDFLITLIKK